MHRRRPGRSAGTCQRASPCRHRGRLRARRTADQLRRTAAGGPRRHPHRLAGRHARGVCRSRCQGQPAAAAGHQHRQDRTALQTGCTGGFAQHAIEDRRQAAQGRHLRADGQGHRRWSLPPQRARYRRGLRCACALQQAVRQGQTGTGRAVAGQAQRSLHPRLEPVGTRSCRRPGNPAHPRWRGKLRLRHRQRRLAAHRQCHRGVVAGLPQDRHLPAGPAQDRRHVPGQHQAWASGAAGVEISAGRRQGRDHDRARHHRRAHPQRAAPEDTAGPTSLHALRRRKLLAWPVGRREVGTGQQDAGVRLHLALPQADLVAHCRCQHGRGAYRLR